MDSCRAASMNAQVLTTTRSASVGGAAVSLRGESALQLVRVDLVLRAPQGLQPVPLGHQDNLQGCWATSRSSVRPWPGRSGPRACACERLASRQIVTGRRPTSGIGRTSRLPSGEGGI